MTRQLKIEVLSFQRQSPDVSDSLIVTDQAVIGRAATSDLVLPDPSRIVSSRHAVIERRGDSYFITDVSANGLFVNDTEEALGERQHELRHGDTLSLGDYSLKVTLIEGAAEPQQPAAWSAPAAVYAAPVEPAQAATIAAPAQSEGGLDAILADWNQAPEAAAPIPHTDTVWTADNTDGEPAPAESPMYDAPPEDATHTTDTSAWSTSPAPQYEADFAPPSAHYEHDSPDAPAPTLPDAALRAPQHATAPGPHHEQQATTYRAPPPRNPSTPTRDPGIEPKGTIATSEVPRDLLLAFCQGAGLDPAQLGGDPAQALLQAGQMLRDCVEGLMNALHVRSSIRNELGANRTMVVPTENNLLKFSVSADDAMDRLFGKPRKGYLSAPESVRRAFHDVREHQVELLSTGSRAVSGLIEKLAPARIEAELAEGSSKLPLLREQKLWKEYCRLHAELAANQAAGSNVSEELSGVFLKRT